MAFVPVPKDLTRVKTKIAFNLSLRQLICFSIAGAIGVPFYLFTRKHLGNDASMFIMIIIMLPFFFMGMYEKDGLTFEKYAKNVILTRFVYPKIRIYKTENFYEYLAQNDDERAVATVDKQPNERTTKKVSKKSSYVEGRKKRI